ncbi:hypothetical protein E3A20_17220, partial [Planctomyces bekefii]
VVRDGLQWIVTECSQGNLVVHETHEKHETLFVMRSLIVVV